MRPSDGVETGTVTYHKLLVPEDSDGQRLDVVISGEIDEHSRTFIQKVIRDEERIKVIRDGRELAPKASLRVRQGDLICVELPPAIVPEILPQDIPLDILYEDRDVLVINKPKGMVVHPSPGHTANTLVNAVMYYCGDELSGIGGVMRPGIVHRIDKDTTGSVLVCKNDHAHRDIAAQLKEHSIKRVYRAICMGLIREDELTVDAPIGRSPSDRKKMAVIADGKEAVTHIKVLGRSEKDRMTYVECRLETGRTHQIRVHMSNIGHPLLGDIIYGNGKSRFKTDGQCLHAMELSFRQPTTGEWVETFAPLPEYFVRIIQSLE